MNYKFKKLFVISIILVFTVVINPIAKAGKLPYDTYNFDYWENVVLTPAAYVPDGNLSGLDLGVEGFADPKDLYVAEDGLVYVADTGNNRIVVLNSNMNEVVKIVDSFYNNGIKDNFKSPSGVCVTRNNVLYVADTANFRVVALDTLDTAVKIISNPTSEVLEDGFVFNPLKVCVDYADRVYVIAKNMFQGIMAFDEKGDFTGFTGTIKVQISAVEKFWRRFSTKAQRGKQILFIPTEFTGIDVDEDGFLYATSIDNEGIQGVRRLNPKGEDVIKKGEKKNVGGDFNFSLKGTYGGASNISDVIVGDNGIYSLLDTRRGRVFTYDHEGNLLYIFGGLGSQAGTFKIPAAIEMSGDKILVLDSSRAEILTFVPTEYGSLINEAVGLRYHGDETLAVEKWEKVLKLDANFELANVGIGKAYLTAGDNKNAMKYLKLGMNKAYYSIAFKRYRNELLKNNLGLLFTVTVLVFIFIRILLSYKKYRDGKGNADD